MKDNDCFALFVEVFKLLNVSVFNQYNKPYYTPIHTSRRQTNLSNIYYLLLESMSIDSVISN